MASNHFRSKRALHRPAPSRRPRTIVRKRSQGKLNTTTYRLLSDRTRVKRSATSLKSVDATNDESVLDIEHTFPNLQRAMASVSVEDLERHTQVGVNVINDIIQRLDHAKHCRDAFHWVKSLEDLTHQAKTPSYVLGVIGATGHGKSSLINALLGEAQLVPTNCMRACTAVITEISWNPSEDPKERYIGNIEFITMEEWHYELHQLFSDLMVSNGELTSDINNKATDAGVAWAKIQAIYPHITKEAVTKTNAESLANDPAVKCLLGVTKIIRGATPEAFYKDIQVYVDSKQKVPATNNQNMTRSEHGEDSPVDLKTGSDNHNSGDENLERKPAVKERKMELWPLIKVVKIQTKADVLSTGLVVVDLPGVGDSNAARAAIAGKYIEKCHGIWIVASIQRAVDDKTAQNLLGRSFKQQMQLDGHFANVSLICSKTDDICAEEAAKSLGLHCEKAEVDKKLEALEKWEASNKAQLEQDEDFSDTLLDFLSVIDRRMSQWELLESREKDGKSVYAPLIESRKRKARSRNIRPSKRVKVESSNEEGHAHKHPSIDDLLDKLKQDEPSLAADHPLTGEDIRSMNEYLRSMELSVIQEKEALDNQIEIDNCKHVELREALFVGQKNLDISCVRRRNDYTREAIRAQYALGLKELDQDIAQQSDPDKFDPEEELRDYNRLANELPVFCVSSRAYQSLCGRIRSRNKIAGFADFEATEVPQLILHAKKLTETRRVHACVQFLNGFLQNMNSLKLWVTQDEDEIHLTDKEKQAQVDNVKSALTALEKDIQGGVSEFIQACHQILTNKLFKRLQSSVASAIEQAPIIANEWPLHRNGDGGLPCNSYKATCRRSGVFSGKLGPRDFNEDLLYPLKQKLVDTWERSFTTKIPKALDKFTSTSEKLLQSFHSAIKAQLQQKSSFTNINVLQTQLKSRADELTHMAKTFNYDITRLQREASRGFHPAITEAMSRTYEACVMDYGPGCFERIKRRMDRDLRRNGRVIFNATADPVKSDLTSLCNHLTTELESKTARILDNMTRDYTNVIVGRDITKESKIARDEVSLLLKSIDDLFEHALRVKAESPISLGDGDVSVKSESE